VGRGRDTLGITSTTFLALTRQVISVQSATPGARGAYTLTVSVTTM
jgi:hypothetical protein